MFIRSLPTTPHQTFCNFVLYSKVIVKSVKDPDDFFFVSMGTLQHEWVNLFGIHFYILPDICCIWFNGLAVMLRTVANICRPVT